MLILHTSDWHLGRTLHGADLQPSQEAFFDHLVEVVSAEQVDAVLVSGDIYDRGIPPLAAVELLDDVLARLAAHTRVILTAGNHDSAVRLGFGSGMWREQVTVRSRLRDIGEPVLLPDRHGDLGAVVFPIPYLDPEGSRVALAGDLAEDGSVKPLARSHEAVLAAALRRCRPALKKVRQEAGVRVPAVVMAHAFVAGGAPSDSERDIQVGGVDRVPAGIFATWGQRQAANESPENIDAAFAGDPAASLDLDYVALGHLHRPQDISSMGPQVRYSGSPIAFSFSEAGVEKSVTLVQLSADEPPQQRVVPAPVLRPVGRIRGTLSELLSPAFAHFAEHWLEVTVTDPERPARLQEQIRQCFPHFLALRHEPPTPPSNRRAPLVTRNQVRPAEVVRDFISEVGGRPMTAAEQACVTASWERVRAARGQK